MEPDREKTGLKITEWKNSTTQIDSGHAAIHSGCLPCSDMHLLGKDGMSALLCNRIYTVCIYIMRLYSCLNYPKFRLPVRSCRPPLL